MMNPSAYFAWALGGIIAIVLVYFMFIKADDDRKPPEDMP